MNTDNVYLCPCCQSPMRADWQQNLMKTGGYWIYTCDSRQCAFTGYTLPASQLDDLKTDAGKLAAYTRR